MMSSIITDIFLGKKNLFHILMRRIANYLSILSRDKNPTFAPKYEFIDRQSGFENLFLILAGFQPYYWDILLERVNRVLSSDPLSADVCVCVPEGLPNAKEKLFRIAEKYNWSVLYIPDDLLAQAQNTAIKLHPQADYIFKIDEDIVLCKNYLTKMRAAYDRASQDKLYQIGYVSPLLNINDYGSKKFLDSCGLMEEFKNLFGEYTLNEDTSKIFKDSGVAEWIWQNSVPFDNVAEKVYTTNQGQVSCSPVRVRIGAILLTRDFWKTKNYFFVPGLSQLGTEELELCGYCANRFYKIVVAEDTFVGHLGFSQQKETCRNFFNSNTELIK